VTVKAVYHWLQEPIIEYLLRFEVTGTCDYFLCFVSSIILMVEFGFGVGGIIFPSTIVTSVFDTPPRGPITILDQMFVQFHRVYMFSLS